MTNRRGLVHSMKVKIFSATNRRAGLLFLLLCHLCACADVRGPTWLTGEPGDEVLSAPRVVSSPDAVATKVWPNLADVPDKKPVFTAAPVRSDRAVDLNSDRLKANAEMERLRNIDLQGNEASQKEALPFVLSNPNAQ